MYIPMIFFSILIKKRERSPEEIEALYRQDLAIKEWEERRMNQQAMFPEYVRW
ncbi:YrzI family small protein [Brevibacillus composti]|uniref:YrzI family small protein n=1 Tax=Brevibacillus composti TaxID=2796470 RepID=A0A7T5JNA2_9BACL|nr:YrzI family small protein [Brevibacillus composti]QQE73800.1 YrzI family small protein [Brevibacillus composti]QUO40884.1 YrzI family small protein [Brevibacillus composti]